MKAVILLCFLAVVVAVSGDCPDAVKNGFADSVAKCKQNPPDDQVQCVGASIRSRPEFAPFVKNCPDPPVKGCLKGEIEKVCPGLTNTGN